MAKDFWGNTFKKVKVEKHVEMEPATFSIKETQEPITIPVKYLSDEKVAQEPKVVYKSAYRIRKNNEVKSNVRHNTYLMNIRKPPPKK